MVERLDRDRIVVLGGTDADVARFVESDFRIRSGMCPNGHGLMEPTEYGQQCPACGFWCNTPAERESRPNG